MLGSFSDKISSFLERQQNLFGEIVLRICIYCIYFPLNLPLRIVLQVYFLVLLLLLVLIQFLYVPLAVSTCSVDETGLKVRSTCFCLQSAVIEGVCRYARLVLKRISVYSPDSLELIDWPLLSHLFVLGLQVQSIRDCVVFFFGFFCTFFLQSLKFISTIVLLQSELAFCPTHPEIHKRRSPCREIGKCVCSQDFHLQVFFFFLLVTPSPSALCQWFWGLNPQPVRVSQVLYHCAVSAD